MSEMNGLSCLVANCGVLHTMTEPPRGEDFSTYVAYAEAKEKWESQQCWRAYVKS